MTRRDSASERRPIYEDNLRVRLDAAMALARRLLSSTLPVRAKTFTPFCRGCQQAGRRHVSAPTYPQRYICARCNQRWITVTAS
jgi:predicted SprT family Zn-dependent metalloprotease